MIESICYLIVLNLKFKNMKSFNRLQLHKIPKNRVSLILGFCQKFQNEEQTYNSCFDRLYSCMHGSNGLYKFIQSLNRFWNDKNGNTTHSWAPRNQISILISQKRKKKRPRRKSSFNRRIPCLLPPESSFSLTIIHL